MLSPHCGSTRLGWFIALLACWPAGALLAQEAAPRLDLYGDPLPVGAISRLGTLRFRHGGDVNTVGFLADGKTVVSGSNSGVYLWEAASGKELRMFPGYRVAVSPDGKLLATLDVNEQGVHGRIHLFDAATGKVVRRFERGLSTLTLAFSPDGKTLAAAGYGRRNQSHVALWEIATGNDLPTPSLGRRFDGVNHLAFAPDGKTLLTSSNRDYMARIWELANGTEQSSVSHTGQVLAYAPDAKVLAVAGSERADDKVEINVVRLLDPTNFQELRKLTGLKGGVESLAFTPDSATVIGGDRDGQILLWETATGKQRRSLAGHRDAVTALAVSPDGKHLVSGSKDKTLCVWDLASGQPLQAAVGHQGQLTSVALTPDGKTAITAGWDRTVRLWDLATSQEVRSLPHPSSVRTVALAANGKLLASKSWSNAGNEALVHLWDLPAGKQVRQYPERLDGSRALAFSPDSRTLASGNDLAVQLWDTATGQALRRAVVPPEQSQRSAISFVAFAPDGKSFAWSNFLQSRQSETATGKQLRQFTFPRLANLNDDAFWGAFSLDGTTLIVHAENLIRVWDLERAKDLRTFRADPVTNISQAALSPDGKMLATANLLGTIRIWELATGKERRELRGLQERSHSAVPKWFPAHQGSATAVAWSADGKRLITGGEDSTVLVWDLSLPDEAVGLVRNPDAKQLDSWWHDLMADDAGKAYLAMRALNAAPQQSATYLRDRMSPAAAVEPRALARLIADLDSQQFAVRQQAVEALESLGTQAVPALREVLTGNPSQEVRQRAEELLEKSDYFMMSGKSLRTWRAIEVLEHLGTPEARRVLETLAKGAAESRLTREAKAALERSTRATP